MFSPESQKNVNLIFEKYHQNPIESFNNGWSTFNFWLTKDGETSTAAANGLMLGVLLCHRLETDPDFKKYVEDSMEKYHRAQGENVVNFQNFKAGKQ